MLYSLLYGNKTKTETINPKLLKMTIQRERVKNDVPIRIPFEQPNLPRTLDLCHGDDLILCEATKMVEDMIENVNRCPKEVKTYQRKKKKILETFGCDSKILQNIIQLSLIYSQKLNNTSIETEESSGLCINCPEVDPGAHKFEYDFSFPNDPEGEDIFSFYDPLKIKEEPISEEVDVASSDRLINAPEINLEEYVTLDKNVANWCDIYSRINDELLSEKLNNDDFLNVETVNKKFYIKIGSTLRLVCISVTDVPNNYVLQKHNEQIVEHKHNLFDEIKVPVPPAKRKREPALEEQSTSKKHLKEYAGNSNFHNLLLDGDDTFINAIKLEVPLPSASPKKCTNDENSAKKDIQQNVQIPSISSANNKFEPSVNQCFDGFQTGRGKPIDLPQNDIFTKYLKLYEDMDITEDEFLST